MEFILSHDEKSAYSKMHKYKQMSDDTNQMVKPGLQSCGLWTTRRVQKSMQKKKKKHPPLKFSQIPLKMLASFGGL